MANMSLINNDRYICHGFKIVTKGLTVQECEENVSYLKLVPAFYKHNICEHV